MFEEKREIDERAHVSFGIDVCQILRGAILQKRNMRVTAKFNICIELREISLMMFRLSVDKEVALYLSFRFYLQLLNISFRLGFFT